MLLLNYPYCTLFTAGDRKHNNFHRLSQSPRGTLGCFSIYFFIVPADSIISLKKARWLKNWLRSGSDNENEIQKYRCVCHLKETIRRQEEAVTVLFGSFSPSLQRFELRARWRSAKQGGIKLSWNYHINGKQMDFGLRRDCRYSATLPRPSLFQRCSVKGHDND